MRNIVLADVTHLTSVFEADQALIGKDGARVMSLVDGTSKMSKSDPVDGSRINLTDSPDVITKKVCELMSRRILFGVAL